MVYSYRGYGIDYKAIGGTTTVTHLGVVLKQYLGEGLISGDLQAVAYIDGVVDHE